VNRNDVVDILTAVAATDHRTVGDWDVAMWEKILGPYERYAALTAVVEHFEQQPGVWLEPGHVVARIRQKRADKRWTPEETAAFEAMCEAKGEDDDAWRPRVARWFVGQSQMPDGLRKSPFTSEECMRWALKYDPHVDQSLVTISASAHAAAERVAGIPSRREEASRAKARQVHTEWQDKY
jgi:hypothetical protein